MLKCSRNKEANEAKFLNKQTKASKKDPTGDHPPPSAVLSPWPRQGLLPRSGEAAAAFRLAALLSTVPRLELFIVAEAGEPAPAASDCSAAWRDSGQTHPSGNAVHLAGTAAVIEIWNKITISICSNKCHIHHETHE